MMADLPPIHRPVHWSLRGCAGGRKLHAARCHVGLQPDDRLGKWIAGLLPLVVMIVVTWLGIKAVREESKDKSLSYGKGVGTGVLIALYASLIGGIYAYIHFTFVNPNFADYAIDMIRQQWVAAGMGDSQMEQAEKFTRFFYKPAVMAVMNVPVGTFFGTIFSLILAIFLRRKPAAVAEAVTPAV